MVEVEIETVFVTQTVELFAKAVGFITGKTLTVVTAGIAKQPSVVLPITV